MLADQLERVAVSQVVFVHWRAGAEVMLKPERLVAESVLMAGLG